MSKRAKAKVRRRDKRRKHRQRRLGFQLYGDSYDPVKHGTPN